MVAIYYIDIVPSRGRAIIIRELYELASFVSTRATNRWAGWFSAIVGIQQCVKTLYTLFRNNMA